MYQTCQLPIFHNANLPLPEMLHCISESVGLQINILLMCIKLVGRIAYYHRGHIALKHGSDWNIPMSEFHLAKEIVARFIIREPAACRSRYSVSLNTIKGKDTIGPMVFTAASSAGRAPGLLA